MSDLSESRKQEKGLFGRVTGAVTGRVVETIDPDVLLEHVDLNALLERVEVNQLLDRIDVDRLLDRVDVDRLLDRVGIDRLLGRVDIDVLLAGVDLNQLLSTVDLESLVRRSGIPAIVAESTGTMAGSALDVARRQMVGLDFMIDRVVDRLLRRGPQDRVNAPPLLREMPGA